MKALIEQQVPCAVLRLPPQLHVLRELVHIAAELVHLPVGEKRVERVGVDLIQVQVIVVEGENV